MTEPLTPPESTSSGMLDADLSINGSNEQLINNDALQKQGRSLAEWITFAIASIILLALIILIIYDWHINQLRPPAFSVTVDDITRVADEQYYIPFEIQNTGGRIARTVQVTAILHIEGLEDETGDQQIDFLSGNERKRGSFVFTQNPEDGELHVRVASYRLP
ncbi:MAG: TIGR02588 family protein [Cyanobacteria bacterium J06627_8]